MVATPGADITPTATGFGDTSWAPSSDSSLLRHAITPKKLGVGFAQQMISNSCVCKGVSCGMVIIFGDLVWGSKTILSSQLQCLSLGPLDREGICPAATTGWDGCNTFSQPRNLGNYLSAAGSLTALMVICSLRVPAGVAVLWGLASSVGMVDISSRGSMPFSTSSSEKER